MKLRHCRSAGKPLSIEDVDIAGWAGGYRAHRATGVCRDAFVVGPSKGCFGRLGHEGGGMSGSRRRRDQCEGR